MRVKSDGVLPGYGKEKTGVGKKIRNHQSLEGVTEIGFRWRRGLIFPFFRRQRYDENRFSGSFQD